MNIKKRLGYFILFCLGVAFVVYKYREIPLYTLKEELVKCNLKWVLSATVCHLVNHALRAYRWKILLRASDPKIKFRSVLLSEMNGFCMTMAFSRLGEIIRCRSLKKLEGTKVSVSLGSIVVERSLDMFFFMVIFLAFGSLQNGVFTNMWEVVSFDFKPSSSFYRGLILGGLFLLFFYFFLYKKSLWHYVLGVVFSFLHVLKQLFLGIWGSDRMMIGISTALIWLFHFLVEYLTFFAFPETSLLDAKGGLFVFLVANLGMAIPIPGGAGVYEILVGEALKKQGVPSVTALAYALITHAIQVFNAFVVGGICSFIILLYPTHEAVQAEKEKTFEL